VRHGKSHFPNRCQVFPNAGVVNIPAQVLRNLIAKTGFAIANEESATRSMAVDDDQAESITWWPLTASVAHVSVLEKSSMGGFRRDERSDPKEGTGRVLKSLLDSTDVESIEFAKEVDALLPHRPRLLILAPVTGQFPNFEAVLPKDNSKSINLHGDEFRFRDCPRGAVCRRTLTRVRLSGKRRVEISASSSETGEIRRLIENDTRRNADHAASGAHTSSTRSRRPRRVKAGN